QPPFLKLQRGPIEFVHQLGVPLPQTLFRQQLGRQALEACDDPAILGIHDSNPPLVASRLAPLPPAVVRPRILFPPLSGCGARPRQSPSRRRHPSGSPPAAPTATRRVRP